MIIFFHHRSDSINEDFEPLDYLLVDIHELSSFEGEESFIVISVFNFDFGDFIDGPSYSSFISIMLDCLFIADDGIVGLF